MKGQLRRAANWVLIAALLFELPSGAAVAMRMAWDFAPMPVGAVPCPEHGGGGGHDPAHAGHDHQQCLLCNVGLGTGTLPVLALLSVSAPEPAPPAPMPERPIVRKDV